MSPQQPAVHTSILAPEMTFHVFSPSSLPRDQVWHLTVSPGKPGSGPGEGLNKHLFVLWLLKCALLFALQGWCIINAMYEGLGGNTEGELSGTGGCLGCVCLSAFVLWCLYESGIMCEAAPWAFLSFFFFFFQFRSRKCKESTEALWVPLGQAIFP